MGGWVFWRERGVFLEFGSWGWEEDRIKGSLVEEDIGMYIFACDNRLAWILSIYLTNSD